MPDPTAINSWPAAVVAVAVVLALAVGQVMTTINSHRSRQDVTAVRETLTTNNHGSHMKDQTDRIEDSVGRMETKLDEHLVAAAETDERVEARLAELEKRRRWFG